MNILHGTAGDKTNEIKILEMLLVKEIKFIYAVSCLYEEYTVICFVRWKL